LASSQTAAACVEVKDDNLKLDIGKQKVLADA
jgi:hypothetical protein